MTRDGFPKRKVGDTFETKVTQFLWRMFLERVQYSEDFPRLQGLASKSPHTRRNNLQLSVHLCCGDDGEKRFFYTFQHLATFHVASCCHLFTDVRLVNRSDAIFIREKRSIWCRRPTESETSIAVRPQLRRPGVSQHSLRSPLRRSFQTICRDYIILLAARCPRLELVPENLVAPPKFLSQT